MGLGQVVDALGGATDQSDRIFTRCWESEGVVSRERAERLERTSGETEPYGDGDNGKGGVKGSPTALKLRELENGKVRIGTKEDGHESTQRGKKSSLTRCTSRQGGLV